MATVAILFLLPVLVFANNAHGANDGLPVAANFQQLCAQPGVVTCVGFDSVEEITGGLTSSAAGIYPELDADIKASGTASLKFTVPSGTGANTSGSYIGDFGARFGQGESFFVSFKQRFSDEMVNTRFGGNGWKQVILHSSGPSCAAVEITMQNTYHRGFPQMYSRCGADNLTVSLPNHDFLLQQGEYECHYQSINASDCSMYKSNQWITFYVEVHIGDWGQPNTVVNAFIRFDGGALKQFIDIDDHTLRYNDDPSDTFAKVQLTPYNTNKSSSQSHPTAYTWYDDLIISRQPIFSVSGANVVRPNPPTDVAANTE